MKENGGPEIPQITILLHSDEQSLSILAVNIRYIGLNPISPFPPTNHPPFLLGMQIERRERERHVNIHILFIPHLFKSLTFILIHVVHITGHHKMI